MFYSFKFSVLLLLFTLLSFANTRAQDTNTTSQDSNTKAMDYSLMIGTDFPYEHYLGFNVHGKNIDFSYRTGFLLPPYSDALINALSIYDVEDVYIDLLESTFEFGWMNSVGAYYRFGNKKQWYLGPELRVDYFNAKTTPLEVVQTLFEQPGAGNLVLIDQDARDIKFGLTTYAVGARVGRTFSLVKDNPHHFLNVEFMFLRYFSIRSKIEIDGNNNNLVAAIADELLWRDFFKSYGQLGVLGVSYSYRF